MNNIHNPRFINTAFMLNLLLLMMILSGSACRKNEETEIYHKFNNGTWARFDLVSFDIPVKKSDACNVYLIARFTKEFQYETLDFNMIMNTPSGEERINEYKMDVKTATGQFCIECTQDSCQGMVLLKKDLRISKEGILKIEIENLIPRITTAGILGVGIRVVPSGK